jgi:uncharacterized protein YecT (DUF1311 family)
MLVAAMLLALDAGQCDTNQNQTGLTACWSARANQADAELNATYKRVQSGLRALGIDPNELVPAETAWIAARDKTCGFEESLYEGGSIAPMIGAQCVDRMTRARTQRLEGLLQTRKAEGVVTTATPVSKSVDAELNRVYGLLMKQQLTAAQRNALVSAEIAWLAYRDKACKLEGGSCFDDLETERTKELEAGWIGEQFW